ncbi:hypothetical protein [Streptomyces platensis]|uniref:hypothetical protein n=1 Tax=Streptomyces platensis TaxID=58346 RepID=UPI0037B21091
MTAAPVPPADITADGTGLLCVTLLLDHLGTEVASLEQSLERLAPELTAGS